jgi:transposase
MAKKAIHPTSSGARSRRTKGIRMLADALGRPLKLMVTAGQVGDITQAPALLDGQAGGTVLADKAYDGNALRAAISSMGANAVIPSNRCRRVAIPHDATTYKLRNQIKRCFGRLKHFRRFATRYDRRTIHFAGFAHLAAMIWLR